MNELIYKYNFLFNITKIMVCFSSLLFRIFAQLNETEIYNLINDTLVCHRNDTEKWFRIVVDYKICDNDKYSYMQNIEMRLIEKCSPLLLTRYIESNQIDEAKNRSTVQNLPNAPELRSYSGYLTVNKTSNSNMFFWFFPSQNKSLPVVLWLQGGPGSSSMFGLFLEIGPYFVDEDLDVYLQYYRWTKLFSVLYIDNPVGTGFSFTDSDHGFSTNQESVADNLYEALQQFFTIFSEYRESDFYITGESYAGKYIPAIGYKLHQMSSHSNIKFKGIAIGNGWIDPLNMLDMASFLYQLGLIDDNQAKYFYEIQNVTAMQIKDQKYIHATLIYDDLIGNTGSYFEQITGLQYYYNYLRSYAPLDFDYYINYLNLEQTLESLHVGCDTQFSEFNSTVYEHLTEDQYKSAKSWFVTLADNYKVLIYSGLLDIIVATPLTLNFLDKLEWKYCHEFKFADRLVWKVDDSDPQIAGYVKSVANFTFVTIRNAGHIVPYDQPRVAYNMIDNFIYDRKFNTINVN